MQGTDRSQPTQRHNIAQPESRPHQSDNNHPHATSGFDKASLFYDAIFQGELAAYILEVQNDGRLRFADANDLVAKIASLPLAQIYGKTPHECLPAEMA